MCDVSLDFFRTVAMSFIVFFNQLYTEPLRIITIFGINFKNFIFLRLAMLIMFNCICDVAVRVRAILYFIKNNYFVSLSSVKN